jgi:hypothetical protein
MQLLALMAARRLKLFTCEGVLKLHSATAIVCNAALAPITTVPSVNDSAAQLQCVLSCLICLLQTRCHAGETSIG